jgi:hypothetical protein
MSKYPFTVSEDDAPVFLCSWNGGEIVELHTKQSLREVFGETNLFDGDRDGWGYEIGELLTFEELLEHLEREPLDKGRVFYNDNMTIQRIK